MGWSLKSLFRNAEPPGPPPDLEDPIAQQTSWKPAHGGGANFRTRQLDTHDPSRWEFRATTGAKFFYGLFIAIGVFWSGFAAIQGEWVSMLLGTVFGLIGGAAWLAGTSPVVFDFNRQLYWTGRQKPERLFVRKDGDKWAPLQSIHALQLLSERVSSKNGSYLSYELNLVLDSGERLNVVDHSKLESIRDEAQRIAGQLNIPVWDAT